MRLDHEAGEVPWTSDCKRMTTGQVKWYKNHRSGLLEVFRTLLSKMFHVAKLGAGGGYTSRLAQFQGAVISGLVM